MCNCGNNGNNSNMFTFKKDGRLAMINRLMILSIDELIYNCIKVKMSDNTTYTFYGKFEDIVDMIYNSTDVVDFDLKKE